MPDPDPVPDVPPNFVTVARDGSGDYNADGTNDHVEINVALAYIHGLGGGTVHLKPGTYIIADTLVLYDNTVLEGEGSASVVRLRNNAGWPQYKALIENQVQSVEGSGENVNLWLRNFKVDGNNANQTEDWGAWWYTLIGIGRARDVNILRMELVENRNDQVRLSEVVGGLVRGNVINNGGHSGVFVLYSEDVLVEENEIRVQINAGVRTYNSNRVRILNNHLYGGTTYSEYGVEINQEGGWVVDDILIQGNRIHDTGLPPIWLGAIGTADSSRARGVRIIGNTMAYGSMQMVSSEKGGIAINNFDDTSIVNNVIYNNYGSGIRFYPYWSAVPWTLSADVRNNIIVGNTEYGLDRNGQNASFANSYNVVWDNGAGNYRGASAGVGDLAADPRFAAVQEKPAWYGNDPFDYTPDFHLRSQGGRWTADGWVIDTVTSPAIDAGDPSSAFANEPAPNGGRINMGAYGNTPEASKSAP